jgi:hypothetical protein
MKASDDFCRSASSNDHVRATEATSNDPTSPKGLRRECSVASVHMKLVIFTRSSVYLPSALLLMRQRLVAAGNGLSTSLSATIKYVRRTASGAAGNGLGSTAKYLRRTRNDAAGGGLGTTIKYLRQTTAASPAECSSPATTAPRGRRKRSGHHDQTRAT